MYNQIVPLVLLSKRFACTLPISLCPQGFIRLFWRRKTCLSAQKRGFRRQNSLINPSGPRPNIRLNLTIAHRAQISFFGGRGAIGVLGEGGHSQFLKLCIIIILYFPSIHSHFIVSYAEQTSASPCSLICVHT